MADTPQVPSTSAPAARYPASKFGISGAKVATNHVGHDQERASPGPIREEWAFRVRIDGPHGINGDGHATPAPKEPLHRRPHTVVGGDSVDDEGRLRLVVSGDQFPGIRPAEDV